MHEPGKRFLSGGLVRLGKATRSSWSCMLSKASNHITGDVKPDGSLLRLALIVARDI